MSTKGKLDKHPARRNKPRTAYNILLLLLLLMMMMRMTMMMISAYFIICNYS
jgi:hypothetical protein